MEQITILVRDKKKARSLLTLLKSLDFVYSVNSRSVEPQEPPVTLTVGEADDAFGMWKDTDITAESLRENAWKRP